MLNASTEMLLHIDFRQHLTGKCIRGIFFCLCHQKKFSGFFLMALSQWADAFELVMGAYVVVHACQ